MTRYIAFLRAINVGGHTVRMEHLRALFESLGLAEVNHGREVYWLCRTKLSESGFSGATLERTLQTRATLRNITTIRKLAAKYCVAE